MHDAQDHAMASGSGEAMGSPAQALESAQATLTDDLAAVEARWRSQLEHLPLPQAEAVAGSAGDLRETGEWRSRGQGSDGDGASASFLLICAFTVIVVVFVAG